MRRKGEEDEGGPGFEAETTRTEDEEQGSSGHNSDVMPGICREKGACGWQFKESQALTSRLASSFLSS